MRRLGLLSSAALLLAAAFLLFSVPDEFEGPRIAEISRGHALHLVDAIAIVPLLIGSSCLFIALHARRARLYAHVRSSPGLGISATFASGAGLGLLLASAFSDFWWWWAIGALLFGATMALAAFRTSDGPGGSANDD